jgi:hypothetical protein
LITRAKIADIGSSYVRSIREMALSCSAKSKKMYANSKQKFLTQDGTQMDGKKQTSFDPSRWYPRWFVEANPLMKLTVGMALFFFTLIVIVIVAVSRNHSPRPIGNEGTSMIDTSSLASVINDTAVTVNTTLDTSSGNQVTETSMPSYTPTFSPTMNPSAEDFNNCIDKPGSFETSRGKSRDCSWLKAKHLERECGGLGGEPSELGLNCKLSCGEYNGCAASSFKETDSPTYQSTSVSTSRPTNKRRKKDQVSLPAKEGTTTTTSTIAAASVEEVDVDGELYFLDATNKLRPCIWLDIRNPTVRTKRRDENCPKAIVQEVCPVSCLDYEQFTATSTVAATTIVEATAATAVEDLEMYFTDTTSQQRSCSWLDVRNTSQRVKRRDANCAKITTQIICPSSCEDYAIPVTVNNRKRKDDTGISASEYVRSHDLVPQDECYDQSGYFLNNVGHPVKCSWLTENNAEIEARKKGNCGQGTSDLALMCKNSCGTC